MLSNAKRKRDDEDEYLRDAIPSGTKPKPIEDFVPPRANNVAHTSIHSGVGIQVNESGNVNIGGNCTIGTSEYNQCLSDLRVTDSRDDKTRIEAAKGGLLPAAYRWILDHPDFQQWRNDPVCRLLWIKGDPGKGKTMLMCGIINELQGSSASNNPIYFFCQATDVRLNNANAVLRSLIYMLIEHDQSLFRHIQNEYKNAGAKLFEGPNIWYTLSRVFDAIIQDLDWSNLYIILDALDECQNGLPELLELINRHSTASRTKWIMSSRNNVDIEQRLCISDSNNRLSLELKENAEQVSYAVDMYIEHRVSELALQWDDVSFQEYARQTLRTKSQGTFLWAALVIQELQNADSWHIESILNEVPSGLNALYNRMMQQIVRLERDSQSCQQLLATISTAYRPLHLSELGLLSGLPSLISKNIKNMAKIAKKCGSFLTIRDDIVSFVHQSAKDFFDTDLEVYEQIFPLGIQKTHQEIYLRSINEMTAILRRDICDARHPGKPIHEIVRPNPDPLRIIEYSCIYWVDHLNNSDTTEDIKNGGIIHRFMETKYLYWLEALALLEALPKSIYAISKLLDFVKSSEENPQIMDLLHDALRFVRSYVAVIAEYPLQIYASALVFSPTKSLTKELFKKEKLEWIQRAPIMDETWSACLQTLEGHGNHVTSVAFSPVGDRLASASRDGTVKLWDAVTGAHLRTIEHQNEVESVAFAPAGDRLASASACHIWVWDATTGEGLQILAEYSEEKYRSVAFSPSGNQIAGLKSDFPNRVCTVDLWDVSTGTHLRTLEGRGCLAFAPAGNQLALPSENCTIKLWDTVTGACLQKLESRAKTITSIAFNPVGDRLASTSYGNRFVEVWDVGTGECLKMIENDIRGGPVAFAPTGDRLALVISNTIELWDIAAGESLRRFQGHKYIIESLAFTPTGDRLASASSDATIKLWDTNMSSQSLEDYGPVDLIAFAPTSDQFASSHHQTWSIKLWDATTGTCLHNLDGHSGHITSIVFTSANDQLASGSRDGMVKLWDAARGICLHTLKGDGSPVVSLSVAIAPSINNWLVSVLQSGVVMLWDAVTGACAHTFTNNDAVLAIAAAPGGTRLASASHDREIELWDVAGGRFPESLFGHGNYVSSIAFAPIGDQLASASWDCTIKIWVWDHEERKCLRTLVGHDSAIASIAFTPTGDRLASASYNGTIKLWDPGAGICMQTVEHGSSVSAIAFTSTGDRLALASCDSNITLWDAETCTYQQMLGHGSDITSIAAAPVGDMLASASSDGTVKLWDAATGAVLQTIDHGGSVSSMAFAPAGDRFASASRNGSAIKLWDVATGAHLRTIMGSRNLNFSIVFASASNWIASISASHYPPISLWDVATGEQVKTFDSGRPYHSPVALSPLGTLIASASYDHIIKLHDTATGVCLRMLEGHDSHVKSLTFATAGDRLASGAWGGVIKLWDTTTGSCLKAFAPNAFLYIGSSLAFSPTGDQLTLVAYNRPRGPVIMLWDVTTGVCLEALSHGGDESLVFMPTGDLITSRAIYSSASSGLLAPKGYGLVPSWITWNGEKVLWVPPEFRGQVSSIMPAMRATREQSLALGVGNRLLVFRFSSSIYQ